MRVYNIKDIEGFCRIMYIVKSACYMKGGEGIDIDVLLIPKVWNMQKS
ncbi:hypothetical protein JOC86_002721 [Bacillus pakistanensis]|uniref:Uncharacterized protein n=1 Tax=Rossellomorea pakistanensis TaxID=992288 RepID=A0ABS2NEC2_9BACI|nr:hypothetical protein [Bacillus pakistanensis]